ncbi:post-transcriptional regulator [Pontibacillus litoralis]|uniref:Post-transcriptional regulator n=1 Tax=Pontibacillus litoralis JSM 072002 TaxID=1385512 RepID=A0A0A5GAG1_9BACI|nr:post-transcriptional regulator [Pontibacillus litoralis]KGX88989.1 hypothetical protein N784_01240 [Pontibacillus litoralis JSM 072002]
MESGKTVVEWKPLVYPVLTSKVEEFQLLGYAKVHEEEVWKCMIKKVWKGKPTKRLYEIVQEIYHLPIGTYMSYITVEAYQEDDLMASIQALRDGESNDKEFVKDVDTY